MPSSESRKIDKCDLCCETRPIYGSVCCTVWCILVMLGCAGGLIWANSIFGDWVETSGEITGARQKVLVPRGLRPNDPNYEDEVEIQYCAEIQFVTNGMNQTSILESSCQEDFEDFEEDYEIGSYMDIFYNPNDVSAIEKADFVNGLGTGLTWAVGAAGVISLAFICLSHVLCRSEAKNYAGGQGLSNERSSPEAYDSRASPVEAPSFTPAVYHSNELAVPVGESTYVNATPLGTLGTQTISPVDTSNGEAPPFAPAAMLPRNDPSTNQEYISPSLMPVQSNSIYVPPA